jgi:hypothetical protein
MAARASQGANAAPVWRGAVVRLPVLHPPRLFGERDRTKGAPAPDQTTGPAKLWLVLANVRPGFRGCRIHAIIAVPEESVRVMTFATYRNWPRRRAPNIPMRCSMPSLLIVALLAVCGTPAKATDGPAAPGATADPSIPEPTDPALRDRERKTLIAFYRALGGPDWIERDFWDSARPVGEWHGVKTDADGRVVQLTIYDNNVTGTLPPVICELERLHTLHLSFNKLSGPLPDGLGKCRALRNLWLKGNKLTGRLPDSVAVLPELEYLDIHANAFTGPLPTVWNTPKLTIFRADDNRISGPLPEQLFRQTALQQIFLINNKLSGPIPTSLGGNLSTLLLSNNQLTGPIPEAAGRLKKLIDLRLDRNRLSGPIPATLVEAPSLQVLRLDHNRFSGSIPPGLAKHLTVFDASDNPDLR